MMIVDYSNSNDLKTFSKKFTEVICENSVNNLMLTGGKTAGQLYNILGSSPKFLSAFRQLKIYFTDERSVSPTSSESNYKLLLDSFSGLINVKELSIYRMQADHPDLDYAARTYEAALPSSIDVLLLTLGDDGHIASLFPYSPALQEQERAIIPVEPNMTSGWRLTITPNVIRNARHIFVLALGKQKKLIYEKALTNVSDFQEIPGRLVLNANWIFGGLDE